MEVVTKKRRPEVSPATTRRIDVLGQPVEVPPELEKVRVSVGTVAQLQIPHREMPHNVFFLNRKRLQKGRAEYGLPGGAGEFDSGMETRNRFQEELQISNDQFEPNKPIDTRISAVPLEKVSDLVVALTNEQKGYVDHAKALKGELVDEFGPEMVELSRNSGGAFQIEQGYSGPAIEESKLNFKKHCVLPIQQSGRTGTSSLRVLSVYEASTLPEPLRQFIQGNADVLPEEGGQVNKPFLLLSDEQTARVAEAAESVAKEAIEITGVKFGKRGEQGRPVYISGQARALGE